MAPESLLKNETAWQAYTLVVKQIPVSGAIPSNQILYVCPPTRMGIGAGDDVPTPVGSNQACEVCNGLVAADDLVFGPEDNAGYFAGFQKYVYNLFSFFFFSLDMMLLTLLSSRYINAIIATPVSLTQFGCCCTWANPS